MYLLIHGPHPTNGVSRARLASTPDHKRPLRVNWVNPGNHERVDQGVLERGERHTSWRSSYLGHIFELVDERYNEVVATFTVRYNSFYVVGSQVAPVVDAEELAAKAVDIEQTVKFEYVRSRSVKRTFTEHGFGKAHLRDVDPVVWGSIQAYYRNNREHGAAREEWDDKGLYVNWWEVEPLVIQMPWALKTMWHDRLQVITLHTCAKCHSKRDETKG